MIDDDQRFQPTRRTNHNESHMKLPLGRTTASGSVTASQRGSAALYVVGALALAGATAALAIDFEELQRNRVEARLDERLAQYAELRRAEDAAGLVQLLGEKARIEFDAEHMASRWAFDDSEVVSIDGSTVAIQWDRGFAQVTWQVRVAETESPEQGADVEENVAGPSIAPAPVPTTHTVEQDWALRNEVWSLVPGDEPWGRNRAEVLYADRVTALKDRFAAYRELRFADDQLAIYAMLTPEDRERTDLGGFLSIFATGAMRVHGMELEEARLDEGGVKGNVTYQLDSELVLAQLPPDMRARLSGTDPAELRRTTGSACTWQFIEGEWYIELEEPPRRGE